MIKGTNASLLLDFLLSLKDNRKDLSKIKFMVESPEYDYDNLALFNYKLITDQDSDRYIDLPEGEEAILFTQEIL